MRVIAGTFRSRPLRSLRGQALRPTSDRLRETLFNILGASVAEALFVDVFAGTGAVGIEALSRGARRAIFIEKHPSVAKLIAANLASLGAGKQAEILVRDALQGLTLLEEANTRADLVFLDPPYEQARDYARVLDSLGNGKILAQEGCVIAEHAKRVLLVETYGDLKRSRIVTQGDTLLSFYRLTGGF